MNEDIKPTELVRKFLRLANRCVASADNRGLPVAAEPTALLAAAVAAVAASICLFAEAMKERSASA